MHLSTKFEANPPSGLGGVCEVIHIHTHTHTYTHTYSHTDRGPYASINLDISILISGTGYERIEAWCD